MATFAYQARNAKGERVSGAHEAADQRAALEALRAEGLFVTRLEASQYAPRAQTSEQASRQENTPASEPRVSAPLPSTEASTAANADANAAETAPLPPRYWLRANSKELALYFRQMHAMLDAGTSLAHALNTMATNAPGTALRTASGEMSTRVAGGHPFSELMQSYPGIFSPLMLAMIRAGEAGGFLDRMCLRLSQYAERDYQIQQSIKRETWYPKLLVVVAFVIPSLVPAVIAFFQGGNPLTTWLRAIFAPALLFLVILLVVRFQNYFAPLVRHWRALIYTLDSVKLAVPIAGKTARALATAKFCRALGALQAAGLGVQRMIHLSADACGNAVIAESARRTIPQIESGVSLTDALESTRQFPDVAMQMLRAGEATGDFDEQLDKVADFLETDAETTVKQSVVVLGIVVFLFVAILVGIQIIQQYVGAYDNLIDKGLELQN